MIEPKLQARARRQRPLPRYRCEHVVQGFKVEAQVIRDEAMVEVCCNCYARQHLLKVTVDGKLLEVQR